MTIGHKAGHYSHFRVLCEGKEGAAPVVGAAAEALILEAVVATSSTCTLEFEVRAPSSHTFDQW